MESKLIASTLAQEVVGGEREIERQGEETEPRGQGPGRRFPERGWVGQA